MFIPTKLLLCFLFLTFFYSIPTFAQPDTRWQFCENTANYTLNSPYQRNLNTNLAALPATNNGFGFFNRSTGQGNDTVNSVALCRGDVNPDACRSCVNDSIVKIRQICPNQKEGVLYYDECMLHYANENLLGSTRTKGGGILYNLQNATNIIQFNDALEPLMSRLRRDAAAGGPLLKFAVDNTTGDSRRIYGLVQCSPDLSEQQCNDCLEAEINEITNLFNGKVGGRMLQPTCNFRYETYPFFNQTASVNQSPPPPPGLQSSPPVRQPLAPPVCQVICRYSSK